jgi:hypothetical protein
MRFLTSALDGGEWSASRLPALTPTEKSPIYPLNKRLDEPQCRYGHADGRQIRAPTENRTPDRA